MKNINESNRGAGERQLNMSLMSVGRGCKGSMMTSSGTENIGSEDEMNLFANSPLPPDGDSFTQRCDKLAP